MRYRFLLIAFYLFGIVANTKSQDYSAYSFNHEFDFNESVVYNMLQDDSGIFWFGTSTGLYSFNGNDFRNYAVKGYNQEYTNLKIDSLGNLWCTNFGGQIFSVENDTLKLRVLNENDPSFISNYFFLPDSSLIIANEPSTQLVAINWSTNAERIIFKSNYQIVAAEERNNDSSFFFIEAYPTDVSKSFKNVSLFEVPKRTLQVNYMKSVNFFGDLGWNMVVVNGQVLVNSLSSDYQIFNLTKEEFIFSTNLAKNRINIFQEVNGEFFVGTNNSLLRINPVTKEVTENLSGLDVSGAYIDKQNNLWISSIGTGLYMVSNNTIETLNIGEDRIKDFQFDPNNKIHILTQNGKYIAVDYDFTSIDKKETSLKPNSILIHPSKNILYNYTFNKQYQIPTLEMRNSELYPSSSFKNAVFLNDNIVLANCFSKAALFNLGKPDSR